jgi:hypothetical protein
MTRDILLSIDENLQITSQGDFAFGESTVQHVRHILKANKGEYRQSPQVGVGIIDYLKDTEDTVLRSELVLQLRLDGFKTKVIAIQNSDINIQGSY